MRYKIGVDFGTTYSKIVYLDERGDLQVFGYPGKDNKKYIPTAVAYQRIGDTQILSLGDAARLGVIHKPGVRYCENFKMLLPLQGQEEWRSQGWSAEEPPAEVTRDYFLHLLREDQQSFEREVGPIESLVVSVPEVWQRTPDNRGAATLHRILQDELGLPLDHLRSEPVCAAAYFAYRYQKDERRAWSGNLLVCDMGGGTFDVALCRFVGQQIEVLDFDGNGHQGLGRAGVVFDRNAVTKAYEAVHGACPASNSSDFLKALRAFEEVKLHEHNTVIRRLELQNGMSELDDTPFYFFGEGYTLTYDQLQTAFQPIDQGIVVVLDRLLDRARSKGWTIDRVAIVGGFGQFPFVQQTILKHLGIGDHDVRFDATLMTSNVRAFAVAYGAALIANGIVQPVERYPHTIGMFAARTHRGLLVNDVLPLIEAGKVPAGQVRPIFSQEIVTVHSQGFKPLPVYIQLRGSGERLAIQTPEVEYPVDGRYHIGLVVDRSNLASLIFKPVEHGEERVYNLGNLSFDLIVEEQ